MKAGRQGIYYLNFKLQIDEKRYKSFHFIERNVDVLISESSYILSIRQKRENRTISLSKPFLCDFQFEYQ